MSSHTKGGGGEESCAHSPKPDFDPPLRVVLLAAEEALSDSCLEVHQEKAGERDARLE